MLRRSLRPPCLGRPPGRATTSLLPLALACCGPAALADADAPANNAPVAALRVPTIAPVDAAVELDASGSFDADGDPLTYIFTVNGAAASTQVAPVYRHVFPRTGLYTATVWVRDLRGALAEASHDLAARTDYPEVPDFCAEASDCPVGDECAAGVCYLNGGAQP